MCRFCENPQPDIFSFRIDQNTGAVALVDSANAFTADATALLGVTHMVIHRNGRLVYATLGVTGSEALVAVVRINPASGSLDPIAEMAAAAREIGTMAMDPFRAVISTCCKWRTDAHSRTLKTRSEASRQSDHGHAPELQDRLVSVWGIQCFGGGYVS